MDLWAPQRDADAREFVRRHLGDALAAFPLGVRDALVAKFVDDYHDPRTAQLEPVLRKRLTDDEARHLLFAPAPQQYKHYADLLSLRAPSSRENEEDPSTWQFVLRKRFLTLFYLKHARNWPLVAEFVLRDGLQVLGDLFMHRDLQMRGQAIDSFVQITSHVAFEWFDDPVGYEARVLHSKMVALAAPGADFLKSIVRNVRLYEQREEQAQTAGNFQRLPGGTFVLLQVLAFFLSWVRKFYTRNELRLSRELLDLLRDWEARTKSESKEELELARQVYEDFSRWPPIEDDHEAPEARHVELTTNDTEIKSKKLFSPRKLEELLSTSEPSEEALEEAISLCSDAIDAGVHSLEAFLLRAKVRARRIELYCPLAKKEEGQLSIQDCKAVLDHDPLNIDAWKCLLRTFEKLEMWVQGRDELDAWQARVSGRGAGEELQSTDLLAEDLAFLQERRAFFDEKAHDYLQKEALERRKHATRAAREQEVMRLLLQRTTTPSAASSPIETPSAVQKRPAEVPEPIGRSSPHDVLTRFRSPSSAKKQPPRSSASTSDAPIESVLKSRTFVRRFAQCKNELVAIRSLLETTPCHHVVSAVENALPETSLALVLEALVLGDLTEDLARVLQHLLEIPRFALVREMASPDEQRKLEQLVGHAHAKLETPLAA